MVAQELSPGREIDRQNDRKQKPFLSGEMMAMYERYALLFSNEFSGVGIPHGNGHPVMVIPGFLGSDAYLVLMREWLQRINYAPKQSGIYFNAGLPKLHLRNLKNHLQAIHETTGRKTSLIGHSLGGLYGMILAKENPDLVENGFSLGSPLSSKIADGTHPFVALLGQMYMPITERDKDELYQRLETPLEVPFMSIYNTRDPIVSYRTSIAADGRVSHRQVEGTHTGLVWNREVYKILAESLAR